MQELPVCVPMVRPTPGVERPHRYINYYINYINGPERAIQSP